MSAIFFPQLFVLEPGLTNTPQLSIEDLARLIEENGSETLRARVVGKNRDGSVLLELPGGHRFSAKLPVDAPLGGRVLLQARPDGTAQLLQLTDSKGTPLPTTPPPAPNTPPVITPTLKNLLNLDVPAKDGMRIQLIPVTNRPLPAVGASVIGTVITPPESGQQTLQMANGAQVKIPLPPVFTPGTEVTMKMTGPQQAEIQRLQLPPAPVNPQPSTQPVLQQPTMMPQSAPTPPIQPQTAPQTPTVPQAPAPLQNIPPQQPAQSIPQPQTVPQQSLPQAPQPAVAQPTPVPQPQPIQTPQAPLPTEATAPQAVQPAPPQQPQAMPRTPLLQLAEPAPDLMRRGEPVTVRFVAPQLPKENLYTPQPQLPKLELPNGQQIPLRTPLAMPANTTLQVQLRPDGQVAILAVREPAPPPAQPQTPAPVVATVVAKGPQPETYVLNFKEGVRVPVLSPQPLPVGAKVMVQILPSGHAEIIDILLPASPQPTANQLLKFSLRWESLQTALSQLSQKAPALAQQVIERLPRIDGAFVPRLMNFVDMIAKPSLDRSVGTEAANMLRALGLDHILQQDMSQLHQLQQRTDTPDSWRALFFPYWENKDGEPRQGSMFWRKQKNKDDDKDSLRVVVHLSLSHLGRVQFDALVKGKQLLIKLRLQEAVDPEFVQGLTDVAHKALDDAGLTGHIGVEQVTHFSVDPLMDMIKSNKALNVKV